MLLDQTVRTSVLLPPSHPEWHLHLVDTELSNRMGVFVQQQARLPTSMSGWETSCILAVSIDCLGQGSLRSRFPTAILNCWSIESIPVTFDVACSGQEV